MTLATEPTERLVLLCRVSLAVGAARPADLESALKLCQQSQQVTHSDVEECLLQGIPYSGFPGAGEGFSLWSQLQSETSTAPGASPSSPPPQVPLTGEAIFDSVYGSVSASVQDILRQQHPQLHRWVLDFAYGEVMGRGIFPLHELEALGVASLLGQKRRTQLHSHLRGALRCGWEPRPLKRLLESLSRWSDPDIQEFACSVVEAASGKTDSPRQ